MNRTATSSQVTYDDFSQYLKSDPYWGPGEAVTPLRQATSALDISLGQSIGHHHSTPRYSSPVYSSSSSSSAASPYRDYFSISSSPLSSVLPGSLLYSCPPSDNDSAGPGFFTTCAPATVAHNSKKRSRVDLERDATDIPVPEESQLARDFCHAGVQKPKKQCVAIATPASSSKASLGRPSQDVKTRLEKVDLSVIPDLQSQSEEYFKTRPWLLESRVPSEEEWRAAERVYRDLEDNSERPHKCLWPSCPHTFKTANEAKRHGRTYHYQLDSWNCPESGCDRKYSRKDSRDKHIREKHPELAAELGIEKRVRNK